MSDHRVNDLSYGHHGEATYNPEEKIWKFSKSGSLGASIQILQPLRISLPASLNPPLSSSKRVSQTLKAQDQWLTRAIPETGPASAMLSLLNLQARKPNPDSGPSTLLAVGFASDIDQGSRTQKVQILAIANGEAGNFLRLIKPRVEDLGWERHNGIKLRVMNPVASDECYWLGEGSPIRQVSFGIDTEGLTSWLAIRRPESTAVLRPVFRRVPVQSTLPRDFAGRTSSSRLCPNHILTLNSGRTGGRHHADVSFNPWYIRQFAIVDVQGYWSIWDIEGQKRKRTTFEAAPGKNGHVHDGRLPESDSKLTRNADGWGRILWAGSFSTLIVCERRSIAVFSLKKQPIRLSSPGLIDSKRGDWILDVKRHFSKLDQIFVLTTTQIFWIEINALGEDVDEDNGISGARILVSCRHFRDRGDDTLKLELLEENEVSIIFLYSGQNELIRTYQFGFSPDGSRVAMSSNDSFTVSTENFPANSVKSIQTLTLVTTTLVQNPISPISGPGKNSFSRSVPIYQLLVLDTYLALSLALCSKSSVLSRILTGSSSAGHGVPMPTSRSGRDLNVLSSALVLEDQFIIPNGLDDSDDIDQQAHRLDSSSNNTRNRLSSNLNSTINARQLFEVAFGERINGTSSAANPKENAVAEFIKRLSTVIEGKRIQGREGLTPLIRISSCDSFLEDVDDVSSMLSKFVEAFGPTQNAENKLKATITFIRAFSFTEGASPAHINKDTITLSVLYDRLVDLWISYLPQGTSGLVRLANEKTVRDIAAELYLSSVALSIRNREVPLLEPARKRKPLSLTLPVRTKHGSLRLQERQLGESVSQTFDSSHPFLGTSTPDPTSSVVSHEASLISGPAKEDDAISRLRGYALSIRSLPPLHAARSSILASWPATPGADPSKYLWNNGRNLVSEDEESDLDDDEAFIRRREEMRRQRRQEKLLKRQILNTTDSGSRPVVMSTGSQPDPVQDVASSQVVEIMSMSQPDRGIFGSRAKQRGFKKNKTRGF